ncbi:MAG: hypothetical protein Q8Q26_08060 [Pseudorhodobacter sp.]|nr:hypothetical protein [Pseudorhodobacter sp.]
MKKITAFVAAATLVASVSAASAGGPVVIYQDPVPVVAAAPVSSGGIWLPLAALALVAAVAASSSGNGTTGTN